MHNTFCWGSQTTDGDNDMFGSEVGDQLVPRPVFLSSETANVAIAGTHACTHAPMATPVCWGDPPGRGHAVQGEPRTVTDLPPCSGACQWADVAVGDGHTCALALEAGAGRVYCFGNSDLGQSGVLADATPGVEAFVGLNPTAIAAGGRSSCAVGGDANVYCIGDNTFGQLGQPMPVSSATPVQVAGVARASRIVGSPNSYCAITTDDEVFCWGSNEGGQLGTGWYRADWGEPLRVTLP